jgi:phosphinothricin acetyltransferase
MSHTSTPRVPAATADVVELVRPAREADIAAIQAIYADHVLHGTGSFEEIPPSIEEMKERFRLIAQRGLPYLVATEDAGVVGFAYVAPFRPRSAYRYTVEDSVYLHPQAIGRGLGRRLLQELINQSAALGFRQMVAVIGDSTNHPSVELHARLRFARVGLLPSVGFKFGRWLDAVFMQRELSPSAGVYPVP